MISIIQIIIIVFVLFAWSRVFLRIRDKGIVIGEFLFWSIIWASVILLTLWPTIISKISGFFGIGRGVDFAIYISILLLFYLIFRLYVKIEDQNQQMTKLIRELSIRDAKKKKSKK